MFYIKSIQFYAHKMEFLSSIVVVDLALCLSEIPSLSHPLLFVGIKLEMEFLHRQISTFEHFTVDSDKNIQRRSQFERI